MADAPKDGPIALTTLLSVITTTPRADQTDHDTGLTRRVFVTRAVKKAAYVAPAVMVLTAARRVAADFTGCIGPGSPCTMHNACCPNAGMECMQPDGMGCMSAPDFTCG